VREVANHLQRQRIQRLRTVEREHAEGARALGQRSFAANERVPVTALLADLPEEAVGFRIESVPLGELPGVQEPPPAPDPVETNDGAPLDAP
jgi:hypothetical protein